MKRRVPSNVSAARWRVTVIAGSRGREVCELQAESAEAAIKRAIREHGIEDPERQKRAGGLSGVGRQLKRPGARAQYAGAATRHVFGGQ